MTDKPAETTYYQQGNITITSTRAVFGANTYALANITSVAAARVTPSTLFPLGMIIGGVLLALAAFNSEGQILCIGLAVVFIVGGVGMMVVSKPSHVVKVGTAGAEQRAYMSADKAEIERIVAALNEAIIKRG